MVARLRRPVVLACMLAIALAYGCESRARSASRDVTYSIRPVDLRVAAGTPVRHILEERLRQLETCIKPLANRSVSADYQELALAITVHIPGTQGYDQVVRAVVNLYLDGRPTPDDVVRLVPRINATVVRYYRESFDNVPVLDRDQSGVIGLRNEVNECIELQRST